MYWIMKIYLMISILLIYFPVLYFFKTRIIKEIRSEEIPSHLKWYEGAAYLIKYTSDRTKREKLAKLQSQIRLAGATGIILFWMIVFFIP